jgi:hypothetical protein
MLDSLDQSATGLDGAGLAFDGTAFSFALPINGAHWRARLFEDGMSLSEMSSQRRERGLGATVGADARRTVSA